MSRYAFFWVAVAALVALPVRSATGEVLGVPDTIKHLSAPLAEFHVLRSRENDVEVGEQRFHAAVSGDRLLFDITTRFKTGDEWDEHGEMDLADGFRSRRFQKTMRRGGQVYQEQVVDFLTGKVEWLLDGVRAERTFAFEPDTYIGPMLAMVLTGVPEKSPAASSFKALVFRPDPAVFEMRAEAVDQEEFKCGKTAEPATKLRVKADLGPVKNMMFASLIPTHFFWFTREPTPEFLAFEGPIADGREVKIVPEQDLATTAHVQ